MGAAHLATRPAIPALEAIARQLAKQPRIRVPTIALCGADDGVRPPPVVDEDAARFTDRYERHILPGVGHNFPQEAPQATTAALLDLLRAFPAETGDPSRGKDFAESLRSAEANELSRIMRWKI